MSDWKQKNREWTANYKRDLREREEARKEAAEKHAKQNAILRANGYRWTKIPGDEEADAFGGTYDSWMLLDQGDNETTVAKALAAIEAAQAAEKQAESERNKICYNCRSGNHARCFDHVSVDKDCQCAECHPAPSTGSALIAAVPEVHVETIAPPSRRAPLPAGYGVAQQLEDGRWLVFHNGAVMTKILKSGEVRIRSYSRKASAVRFIRQHAA